MLLWTNNHGYLQAWKSRPIKRDYDHILKTLLTNYLQAYNISRRCMWHLLRGRLREGAESYAKALASDILR
ncbi:hypothetical protein FP310_17555 [Escherichia coli]|nr:hypothetical protein [Escherichia coli]